MIHRRRPRRRRHGRLMKLRRYHELRALTWHLRTRP